MTNIQNSPVPEAHNDASHLQQILDEIKVAESKGDTATAERLTRAYKAQRDQYLYNPDFKGMF